MNSTHFQHKECRAAFIGLVPDINGPERFRIVAAFTGRAERASVLVIRGVATHAPTGDPELSVTAGNMTSFTCDRRMLPRQGERGLSVVIKCPVRPALRIVTCRTIGAQTPFVDIILPMAILAR